MQDKHGFQVALIQERFWMVPLVMRQTSPMNKAWKGCKNILSPNPAAEGENPQLIIIII